MTGFSVDLDALDAAAQGARNLVAELAAINGWGGAGQAYGANGRGLDALVDDAPRVGGDGSSLRGALVAFGRKWEWGNQKLIEAAQSVAEALTETVGEYRARDRQAADEIRRAVSGE